MFFWSIVIICALGVLCDVIGNWIYRKTLFDTEWLWVLGRVIWVLATLGIVISLLVMFVTYGMADATVAENNMRYESLTYQLENNLYDNDNDVGKKELYNQAQAWNEDLAYYKTLQDEFWFGIYIPNIYDSFEFIKYKQAGDS